MTLRPASPRLPAPTAPGAVLAELRGVDVSRRGRPVLRGIDLQVRAGELLAIAGPNGSGKSSLLAVLAGDLRPDTGVVELYGEPLGAWSRVEQAQRRAVLLQKPVVAFGFSATEIVAMGRAPWARSPRSATDAEVVRDAMTSADVLDLADRQVTALSGGEQARVHLARTLAQQTDVVLLDEPTASLDLRHTESVLRHARQLTGEGRAVVVVVHDLNLAASYGDRVAVLSDGLLVECGPPREVLTDRLLSAVYQHPVDVVSDPRTGSPLVLPKRAGA